MRLRGRTFEAFVVHKPKRKSLRDTSALGHCSWVGHRAGFEFRWSNAGSKCRSRYDVSLIVKSRFSDRFKAYKAQAVLRDVENT